MKTRNAIITTSIIALLATGCSHAAGMDGGIRKQDAGALTGAVGGAWIGSNVGKGKGNVAAIALGTLLGAYLGSEVGASMDRADVAYMKKVSYSALESNPSGASSSWVNPDSGNRGTFTPTRTYQLNDGSYCREYTNSISVGGKVQEGYGRACRKPDGSWEIES